MKTGTRVRLKESRKTGTVKKVVRGSSSNSVLVEWDLNHLDSNWNWYKSSWEPAHHLTDD